MGFLLIPTDTLNIMVYVFQRDEYCVTNNDLLLFCFVCRQLEQEVEHKRQHQQQCQRDLSEVNKTIKENEVGYRLSYKVCCCVRVPQDFTWSRKYVVKKACIVTCKKGLLISLRSWARQKNSLRVLLSAPDTEKLLGNPDLIKKFFFSLWIS